MRRRLGAGRSPAGETSFRGPELTDTAGDEDDDERRRHDDGEELVRFGSVRFGSVRFGSVRFGSSLLAISATVVGSGCPTSGSGDSGAAETGETGIIVCETDAVDGQWAALPAGLEDWSNVATGGNDVLAVEADDLAPEDGVGSLPCDPTILPEALLYGSFDRSFNSHHCFTTAVHAAHLPTRELFVMHGENDQRVWPIGSAPQDMRWHPIPIRTRFDLGIGNEWFPVCKLPDLFCTGHLQAHNGTLWLAGGNVTGNASGGGLNDTYLFDPWAAGDLPAPEAAETDADSTFGWLFVPQPGLEGVNRVSASGPATFDRWYPTLTALPDGRILLSGGDSRAAALEGSGLACVDDGGCEEGETCASGTCGRERIAERTRVLEVYDPETELVTVLGGESALFPDSRGMPQYPFMFVLPNGHVLYAGSDDADGTLGGESDHFGQILVPQPRGSAEPWAWLDLPDDGIESFIRGASAVMYQPGRIMKSGGLIFDSANATAGVEVLDLTAYAQSDDPADIPAKFCSTEDPDPAFNCSVDPMHRARHFHTLTMLPDGRVAATGGNRRGNAESGESFRHPCDVNGEMTDACDPTVDACIEEVECTDGCPSMCVQTHLEYAEEFSPNCETAEDVTYACSLINLVPCSDAVDCGELDEADCVDSLPCHWDDAACVPTYTCDDILSGATCDAGRCGRPCDCTDECAAGDQYTSCGELQPYFDPDLPGTRCVMDLEGNSELPGHCTPLNNACFATKTAEIWDPNPAFCGGWTEFDEEDAARMYHSSALLLPDARVISMGGGHRGFPRSNRLEEQSSGQYFAPTYSAQGAAPEYAGVEEGDAITIFYPGQGDGPSATLINLQPGSEPVDHVALVKLGSATHGFDMGQSYMRLGVQPGDNNLTLAESTDPTFPFSPETATPGYYMAFLMSASGEPSGARYAHLPLAEAAEFVCEIDDFVAEETSCDAEPISGVCPTGSQVTAAVDPPWVEGVNGSVPGFRVVAPAGSITNPEAPTARELTAVASRCAMACEQYFAERPGVSADCSAADAMLPPVLAAYPAFDPVDFVHPGQRHGEGLFSNQQLTCDLGDTCYAGFDELLRPVASDRVTAANASLGVDEEWRVNLGGQMQALASTGGSPSSATLAGTIGYSLCAAGNGSAPCPFFLGSLDLELTQSLVLPVTCEGVTETHTLSGLEIHLEQPAFGISQQGTAWKAFPPGALVLRSEGHLDGVPFEVRRPNQAALKLRAGQAWVLMQGADGASLEFSVPCGDDEIDVLVWWGYSGVGVEDHPPQATIGVPSAVACPSTRTLSKSLYDADGDLASARWFVDGVLMQDGLTSMAFTQAHQLKLVARDARGATTTAIKNVGCQ